MLNITKLKLVPPSNCIFGDASCCFDFSASSFSCQVGLLAVKVARFQRVLFYFACALVEKFGGFVVEIWRLQ